MLFKIGRCGKPLLTLVAPMRFLPEVLLPVSVQVGHLREELLTSFELALKMFLLVMNPIMFLERVEEREGLSADPTPEHPLS